MTPTEFKSIRIAQGLSQKALARALGVSSARTVRRWEAGERDIPGPVQGLMRLLEINVVTEELLTFLQ